jgi:hypothetical protein
MPYYIACLLMFVAALTYVAFTELNWMLKRADLPIHWVGLPAFALNAEKTGLKGVAQKLKGVMQVIHLICLSWLTENHFSTKWKRIFARKFPGENWVGFVLDSLINQASVNRYVFAESAFVDPETLHRMQVAFQENTDCIFKLWHASDGINTNLPNRHVGCHHIQTHLDYGLNNTNGARFETNHTGMKAVSSNSSHHHPELDMIEAKNVLGALQLLAAGGAPECVQPGVAEFIKSDPIFRSILSQATSFSTYAGQHDDDVAPFGANQSVGSLGEEVIRLAEFHDVGNLRFTAVSGLVRLKVVKRIILKNREKYAASVQRGGWYDICVNGEFAIGKVMQCFIDSNDTTNDSCYVRVSSYRRSLCPAIHNFYYTIEPVGIPEIFLASSVMKPVHVVHKCSVNCKVKGLVHDNKIMYGLVADHDNTNRFLVNPFFLK